MGRTELFLLISTVIILILSGLVDSQAGELRFGAGKKPAQVHYISSILTETGQAVSGTCAFESITVRTDGTNNVTINVYAGTDNSGTKLIPTDTVVLGNSYIFMIEYATPLEAVGGVYVEITTAGTCAVTVVYDQG